MVGCDQLEAMVLEACPVCGCDVGLVECLDQCMFASYHKCPCKGLLMVVRYGITDACPRTSGHQVQLV